MPQPFDAAADDGEVEGGWRRRIDPAQSIALRLGVGQVDRRVIGRAMLNGSKTD